VQDLQAGHVSMMFDILTLAFPQVEAGKVRLLAITSAKRDSLFPDVPTTAEAGFPQLEGGPWFGFSVPAKTPRPIINWHYAVPIRA
jgi:tripartite-type tricarboxylate transporter receptor subunit TctC